MAEQNLTTAQTQLRQHFAQLVTQKKLVHAYLFAGPQGVGKKALALWVAQGIFCEAVRAGVPCGRCNECRRIAEHNHPDVVEIVPDGLSIKVDQIRFLKAEFTKSGVESRRKVFIIQEAERMTNGAANSLLKFLEEPSGDVTAFLLSANTSQILPTILSRCQLIELPRLPKEQLQQQLIQNGIGAKQARILANVTESVPAAEQLQANEHFDSLVKLTQQWFNMVIRHDPMAFVLVQSKLMPEIVGRDERELCLQLVMLLARDLLLQHLEQDEEVVFTETSIETLGTVKTARLVTAIELVLKQSRSLTVNVSFQTILEKLTLRLMDLYTPGTGSR
ncbi:DNA polymerase III subunit delta' [Ligilactobacillus saerimneri]|uniref:DNA polymerase III subunit delta' n=1 Tax=Ligilactobacillus saerimneri TaxID=228229 RepID=UPI0030CD4368